MRSVATTLLILALAMVATAAVASRDNYTAADVKFIRSCCDGTTYPRLCFASLLPYAATVHRDPVKLAAAATDVSLARVRAALAHVSALHPAASRAPEAAALRDCAETLGDAADQTRRSATEIRRLDADLGGGGGDEVAWHVSNAQTWMSAAITNEDTCVEGLDGDVGPSAAAASIGGRRMSVRSDVCRRVRRAKRFTSNALALVNQLVGGN